jgi:hypothetical protein
MDGAPAVGNELSRVKDGFLASHAAMLALAAAAN